LAPPEISEIGIKRFDELVKHAEQKNVTLAFENLRNVKNLEYIMEHYADRSNVKYCYDCGHEYCYTKDVDWIEKFGDKLCCTHIHDNFGIKEPYQEATDLHLLPFDGDFDYKNMIERLDKIGYTGSLMLEVFNHTKPEYMDLSEEEFLKTSYERIRKIAEL
jgi:sugar phosphate isomerase/epimerase